MKPLKLIFLFLVFTLLAFTSAHKFYVSVTQIEYVKEKESVQIITRIFIDDFENLLRQRYDETITLADVDESEKVESYMGKYLTDKIKIKINEESVQMNFLGKEYEDDIVFCYLEIEGIKEINTFEITNQVLFDLFEEQQNIVRTKINSKSKSLILIAENDKGLLNFN